ncbi:MAG: outer membrane lipoprotein chaperone LolA [Immundisolibacter sp.]|uniref:outer membrane lipoprotein chaperone LolA n=1 Tax=Immundisolibacter sp. TaxID=1934948 RepID=UPI003D149794
MRALIALVLVLLAGPLAAAGVDALERFYADTRTLAGRFTQTVRDGSGTVTEESRGTFAIERPGRFRWDYETPYEQTIVADGRELWVYEPDLDQATVRPIDEQTADAPGLLLSGARFPSELFDVSTGKDGWLTLTPRRKDSGLGDVRLQLADGSVRTLELADGLGQTTRIEFEDTQRNGPIPAARFHFTPPAGIDVIRGLPQASGR